MASEEKPDPARDHVVFAHALEQEAENALRADPLGAELLAAGPRTVPQETTRITRVVHLREVARQVEQRSGERRALLLLGQADQEYWAAAMCWKKWLYSLATRTAGQDDPEDVLQDYLHAYYSAAQRYEPDKGFRFSTYAENWVRVARQRRVRVPDIVDLPVHARTLLGQSFEVSRRLGTEDNAAIAKELGVSTKKLAAIRTASNQAVRLDAPIGEDDGSARAIDFLAAEQGDDEERVDAKRAVVGLLDLLDARERTIIEARYGLGGKEETFQSLGEQFGLSRERIRQIELKALEKLRIAAHGGTSDSIVAKKKSDARVVSEEGERALKLEVVDRTSVLESDTSVSELDVVDDPILVVEPDVMTPIPPALEPDVVDLVTELEEAAEPLEAAPLPLRMEIEGRPLRSYQEAAVKAAVHGLASGDRGQILMPCGSGKTLVALHVAAEVGARRLLLLFPSLALLSQTLDLWRQSATFGAMPILPVCADPSVAEEVERVEGATTDPELIARWLHANESALVMCTYQSANRVANAMAKLGAAMRPFDLTILDEAHRCAGRAGSAFSLPLTDAVPSHRRLSITATPRLTVSASEDGGGADVPVLSMDDPLVFGPVFFRMSLHEAIKSDVLSDYQIVVSIVRNSAWKTYVTDEARTDLSALAIHVALSRCMKEYGCRRVVSFHNRVSEAAEFSVTLDSVADTLFPGEVVAAEHIHGKQPAWQRHGTIERLRDVTDRRRVVVSNARCLTEGVDVPALDAILFASTKRSEADVAQIVGRVLRKSPGKERGVIMLPIVVPDDCDPIVWLDKSAFEPVWAILRAMRAHDVEFRLRLDRERREGARDARPAGALDKVTLLLPDQIPEAFLDAFWTRSVTEASPSWEEWFGMLERYVQEHGHASPPVQKIGLGHWVMFNRRRYVLGRLPSFRAVRLESLPGWTWNARDAAFMESLLALRSFAEREGHVVCPNDAVECGISLSGFIAYQRKQYRLGQLGLEKVKLLESVRGWAWDPEVAAFNRHHPRLLAFCERECHANVPQRYRDEEGPLGMLVNQWRMLRRSGQLVSGIVSKLESLPGWTWEPDKEDFERKIELLRAFIAREGHAKVPRLHEEKGCKLGVWAHTQRQSRSAGTLAEDRVAALSAIPEWEWSPSEAEFQRKAQAMRAFAQRTGHCAVPTGHYENDLDLFTWTRSVRAAYRRGALTPEQVADVESIPGWSWTREVGWYGQVRTRSTTTRSDKADGGGERDRFHTRV